MIVKNEEKYLEECLSRAKKLVDKIFITDTGSTDSTVEIAKQFGAQVSFFEWINDFSAARNFALDQSDCDWNLVLDADEHLLSGSREDIQRFIEIGTHKGAIQRRDFFKGPKGEDRVQLSLTTRLFPKGTRYAGQIHEQVVSELPSAKLPLVFNHYGYLSENKGERNLSLLLEQLNKNPDDPYTLYQTAHTLYVLKDHGRAEPYFEKFYRLVPESAGYRCSGVLSYLMNLIELESYEKVLELFQKEDEIMSDYADYHFLCGNFYIKLILSNIERYIHFLPKVELSFRRCLEIGEGSFENGEVGCGSFLATYNLGVWYEVNGRIEEAKEFYQQSAKDGYRLAKERLDILASAQT